MDLTEFLDARISEDEAGADLTEYGRYERDMRTLAECKAKRAILALHSPERAGGHLYCTECGALYEYPCEWPCPTLRILAAVYSDHPDYDPTWVPE